MVSQLLNPGRDERQVLDAWASMEVERLEGVAGSSDVARWNAAMDLEKSLDSRWESPVVFVRVSVPSDLRWTLVMRLSAELSAARGFLQDPDLDDADWKGMVYYNPHVFTPRGRRVWELIGAMEASR